MVVDYIEKDKPQEGPCESYHQDDKNELIQCSALGKRRIDRSLDSGIHCDLCWENLVSSCRSRSW